MRSHEDIDNLFSFHKLDSDGANRIDYFRAKFKALAHDILNGTTEGPERTLVLRKLHESMMQLNVLISLDYPTE